MAAGLTRELSELLQTRKVIVCCGAGGVGKTTTSAALGLAAAKLGRRVLVLTIDPARRLAQAMGIQENTREPAPLSRERLAEAGITTGTLDAWMLNPDVVFEGMVRRLATSEEQARRIIDSRLFKAASELVSGMQEYSAAEALYEFSTSGRYDLVVLDTPPARNALDFLEAPGKLARFLDERILGMFMPSKEKKGLGLFKKATELIGTVLTKVFGSDFFGELQQFLGAFSGMFGPMRQHAEGVRSLLGSEHSAFLLVTSPDQSALAEARYFRDRILEMGLPFAGFVLNRSWARTDGFVTPESLELTNDSAPARSGLTKLKALARVELERVSRDRALLKRLTEELPGTVAVAAPYLGEAIEDLKGLALLAHGIAAART
ncbi:MAG: ArsA family ATPase [Archangiaceae bacterium]|nr:ArsA family ATPase [Archangiaceae bacterium]